MPTQGIHNVIPTHYPIQHHDDLQRSVQRQQQQLVKEKGIDPTLAGLAHHVAYAQILKIQHLKGTIVGRYGHDDRLPTGFMTRVEDAMAAALSCSVDNIKKLRKAISNCLRGKRDSVSW
jgi:predicted metal-dependent phosphotriesterase family hydrolase